jgi:large subunit ribosomal protein L7/L12
VKGRSNGAWKRHESDWHIPDESIGTPQLPMPLSQACTQANSKSKTRLNIPDMPMGGFASGPAGAAPAAAPVEEEEAAPAAQEKTMFNLKLEKFDAGAKPKVIKEIKAMLGLSLVDSKKFVESAPKMMKEGVAKEEAEKIVETLKALGATVVME